MIQGETMSLELTLVIVGLIFLFLILGLFFYLKDTADRIREMRRFQAEDNTLLTMQQQINHLTTNVTQQIQHISGQFQRATGHIGSTIGDVKKDMGKMEAVTREVLEKAKNIANLENLLKAPTFRGGLGELFLGDLLSQILPPAHYTLQHKFKTGDVVDAAIRIGSNVVPIDAKFPLDNFKRYVDEKDPKARLELKKRFANDVKKHINDIAAKYILPDENTYDFALMYIPAENIYYESILRDDKFDRDTSIFSFAMEKRVIPVSPNSFFAYLQVIVLGLKGLQIEQSAKEIYQSLTRLQRDLERFKKDYQILGSHLINARTKYDEADKRLEKLGNKLELMGAPPVDILPDV